MAMRCALMAHPSASPAGAPHGHAQGSASATYDPQLLARSLVHRPSRAERGRLERGQIGPVPFPHVLRRKHPRAALTRRHGRGGARRHEIGLEDRVAGGRRRSEASLLLVPRDDCCLERDIQTSLQLALTASAAATDSGGGSYFYRYRLGDRRREIGLGSRDKVSLADACKVAKAWAVLRDEGHDPVETRRRERADNLAKSCAQQPITFKQVAETYLPGCHSTSYEPKLSPMVDDLRRLAGQAACRSSVAAREAFCMEHDAGADCEPAECSSYREGALEAPPGLSRRAVASAWMKAKCR